MTGDRSALRVYLAATAAAVLLSLTLLLGLHGLGRPGLPQLDFLAYYGAGSFLLEHQSPYGLDPATPARMAAQGEAMRVFAYPPNMAPLVMSLSALTYRQARYWFNALNVLAVLAFGVGVAVLTASSRSGQGGVFRVRGADRDTVLRALLAACVAWVPPYAAHSLWIGNIAALTMACTVWAWWFDHRKRPVVAGILLGIAALKPPTVLLAGLWLLLQRRWTTLVVAGVVVILMSAPMMAQLGAVGAWTAWLDGLRAYAATPENQPTGEMVIGLRSVLVAFGIGGPDLTVLGIAATLLLWRYGRPISPVMSLALLSAFTLIFFHGHMLALLWLGVIAGAWLESVGTGRASLIAGAIFLAGFVAPREILRLFDAPDWVLRYRTVEVLVVTGVILYAAAHRHGWQSPTLSVADRSPISNGLAAD